MGHVFISCCETDREFADNLRKSLEFHEISVWAPDRETTAADAVEQMVQRAVEGAVAVIVVLGTKTMNDARVQGQIKAALKVQKEKRKTKSGDESLYPVFPVLLEGVSATAVELFFRVEVKGVPVGPGGIAEAMPLILAALGERKEGAPLPMLRPQSEPLEELVLELTFPRMVEINNQRRAQADAKLLYVSEVAGKRDVQSEEVFEFTVPLGPIERDRLKWYLEHYYKWPVGVFKQRAEATEADLPKWGRELYDAVMNESSVRTVLNLWKNATDTAARRFTVFADPRMKKGTKAVEKAEANEAATLLLTLPWELIHDGRSYLFQGAGGGAGKTALAQYP